MNERIRLFWEEAAKTTQGNSWEEQKKFMERYTELIVRECCDKFVSMQYKYPVSISAYEIKKHFGVEE